MIVTHIATSSMKKRGAIILDSDKLVDDKCQNIYRFRSYKPENKFMYYILERFSVAKFPLYNLEYYWEMFVMPAVASGLLIALYSVLINYF